MKAEGSSFFTVRVYVRGLGDVAAAGVVAVDVDAVVVAVVAAVTGGVGVVVRAVLRCSSVVSTMVRIV